MKTATRFLAYRVSVKTLSYFRLIGLEGRQKRVEGAARPGLFVGLWSGSIMVDRAVSRWR